MSERIITLFGEEIVPEQLKAVGKSRAKKKPEEKKEEAQQIEEQESQIQEVTLAIPGTEGEPVAQEEEVIEENRIKEETEAPVKEGKKKKELLPAALPPDWQGDNKYYSIGEVAELFKVKTSHIRFWTNEFKMKVRTTRKGDRLYTTEQIKEIRAIHHLVKERGFTLTGAKAKLKSQNNMDVETVDLKQSLLQLRNKLMAIKNQLK